MPQMGREELLELVEEERKSPTDARVRYVDGARHAIAWQSLPSAVV